MNNVIKYTLSFNLRGQKRVLPFQKKSFSLFNECLDLQVPIFNKDNYKYVHN